MKQKNVRGEELRELPRLVLLLGNRAVLASNVTISARLGDMRDLGGMLETQVFASPRRPGTTAA